MASCLLWAPLPERDSILLGQDLWVAYLAEDLEEVGEEVRSVAPVQVEEGSVPASPITTNSCPQEP